MGFQKRPNPDFSWSSSRARMFEECNLCYGLYYYGAHNGWLNDASPLAAAAYRYKVTKSTEGLLNDSVTSKIYDHYYKDALDEGAFLQGVRDDLNRAFLVSKNHKEEWYKRPKKVPMLREMVNTDELPKALIADVVSKMGIVVDNFYKTKTNMEMQQVHKLQHLSRFNKFTMKRLDDLTVFIGLHLLYQRDSDKKLVAVNFKTSDEESHIDQLGSIALYLQHVYGVELSEIVLRDEFLLSGTSKEHVLVEDDIEEMYEVIQDSVSMMAEYVVDGDITTNKGVPLGEFLRNPSHSDECGIANCPYCQLVKLDVEEFPNGVKSYAI